MSEAYPLPPVFQERIRAQLGAEADDYFAALAQPYVRGLRLNPRKPLADPAARIEGLGEPVPWQPRTGRYLSQESTAGAQPLHEAGAYYIQEPSAMAAVAVLSPRPGERVLDLCAAPGGKSFSAAFAMEDKGEIVSCDLHENKLKRIQEGAARLDLTSITTSAGDGRVFRPEWAERFDTVLVDAPCSGLGIIRKKPDVRYKKADDLFTLPVIQTALLDNAAQYVAPGGVLVYSTCTILPEENEQVTDAFLTEHSDFCRDGFTLPAPVGETEGQLTLWPQRHGTDGFYICRMKRT